MNDTDLYVNPSCLENENKSQPQSNGLRKQSKTEWPNIPDLSTLPNINSGLLQKTSTPINDINSKLDQLLGKSIKRNKMKRNEIYYCN